jgi:hypothetical protein
MEGKKKYNEDVFKKNKEVRQRMFIINLEEALKYIRQTFHTSTGRKPKPVYFKMKCGIIPGRLLQMRLPSFRKQFLNEGGFIFSFKECSQCSKSKSKL